MVDFHFFQIKVFFSFIARQKKDVYIAIHYTYRFFDSFHIIFRNSYLKKIKKIYYENEMMKKRKRTESIVSINIHIQLRGKIKLKKS